MAMNAAPKEATLCHMPGMASGCAAFRGCLGVNEKQGILFGAFGNMIGAQELKTSIGEYNIPVCAGAPQTTPAKIPRQI